MVSITHEQNIICNKRHLEGTTYEQTIICRKLFACHVVGSWPMKSKGKMHRMIIIIFISYSKCKIPQCLQSSEKKLESQLANYACPAQALLVYFLSCWRVVVYNFPAGPLPIKQARIKLKLLIWQENVLVLDDQTDFS